MRQGIHRLALLCLLALILAAGPSSDFAALARPMPRPLNADTGTLSFIPASAQPERSRRTFQGIPTIASVENRLWAAFYGDDKISEEGAGNYIILKVSDDRGRTWTEVGYVVANDPGMRTVDPQLWRDPKGALWLLFAITRGVSDLRYGVYALVIDKPDQNPQQASIQRLADAGVPGKPVLIGGKILVPVDLRESPQSPLYPQGTGKWIYALDYQHRTLTKVGKIPDTPAVLSYQETSLVPLDDGTILAVFRTREGQYISRSTGDLNTWSAPEPWSALPPNPESRARAIPLPGGALAVAFNSDPKRRRRITVALSTDGGRSLASSLRLTGGEASYPDLTLDGHGNLIVVWDSGRATKREIAGAFVSEAALASRTARQSPFIIDRQSETAAGDDQ